MISKGGFEKYLLRGVILGTAILGVGGRLVMTAFSILTGAPLAFTLRGTLAVVVTGRLYGLLGGAICWLLDQRLRIGPLPRAATGGLALFVLIAAVAIPNDQAGAALERPVLSIGLFLPLAMAFTAAVDRGECRATREDPR